MATLRLCSVAGCDKPLRSAIHCAMHHGRLVRNGDPLVMRKKHRSINWIRAHVSHTGDDCLIWPFSRNAAGYGVMSHPDKLAPALASRVMCSEAHGQPPRDKVFACHSCNNGHLGCVNPKHLRWDDQIGNEFDRIAAGTSNRGARHGMSRLAESDVLQIRKLSGTMSQRDIAAKFDVSVPTVAAIIKRQRWAWLD